MMQGSKKRIALVKAAFHPMSLFVIVCGVVAVFYLFYRIGLVAYPVVVLSENILHPPTSESVVCAEENEKVQDPTRILSSSYQKRINDQKALTKNLVTNPSITNDDDSQLPAGYKHNSDAKNSHYQYLKGSDGKHFLRAVSEEDVAKGKTAPAWLVDPVNLNTKATYRYKFEYRSTVPVHITTEIRKIAHGKASYSYITTVEPSSAWRTFTAHTNNIASLRVIASGIEKGRVDTRGFNVQQIPDAKLSKGTVSVTFDDGWQSVNNAAKPLLEKYDIRTTQYIIAEAASHSEPGYMNLTAIADLHRKGHEIGSHSLTHCNQTDLTTNDMRDNATRSKQALELNGLGPIKSFAYPLGQYDKKTQEVFPQTYSYVRSSDVGYNDRYFDETNIKSMGVMDTTSETEFKSWIDHAKDNDQWLVLVYHRVDEKGAYNVTHEQLDRQLSMIASSGLNITPLGEAADATRKEVPKVTSHTPHELPHTGAPEAFSHILGLSALTATGSYWQASRREKSKRNK